MPSEKRIRLRADEILEIYRALWWSNNHNPGITKHAEPDRKKLVENLEQRFKLYLEDKKPSQYKRRRRK